MIDLESELQGDMEEIVFALLMTPTEYDAYVVHKAVEEMGISEATLIGILCTRSSKVSSLTLYVSAVKFVRTYAGERVGGSGLTVLNFFYCVSVAVTFSGG